MGDSVKMRVVHALIVDESPMALNSHSGSGNEKGASGCALFYLWIL